MMSLRARSEMDITPVFGTDIGGSSPSGRTNRIWSFWLFRLELLSRGYRLVVGHVLAKDEVGVRFSLPAPSENRRIFRITVCLYFCG